MKKLVKLPLLLFLPLFFWTCSKDPETPKANLDLIEEEPAFEFEDEKVSVYFSGNVDYLGRIMGITLKIGKESNLSDAENYAMQLVDAAFSIWVPNLNPNAEYHYCYCVDYGVSTDYVVETKKMVTPSLPVPTVMLPTVVTEEISPFGVIGNVTNDGGAHVTERGICWGMEPLPDISGDHVSSGEDTGSFMVVLPNLESGVYYVRAYATNSVGTAYGEELLLVAKGGCQ